MCIVWIEIIVFPDSLGMIVYISSSGLNLEIKMYIHNIVVVFLYLDNLVWQFTRRCRKLSQVYILFSTVYNSLMR